MTRTIIQPGTSEPRDLFLFAHINPAYVREQARLATDDAVATELRGAGTSAYRGVLRESGGSWRSLVAGVEAKLSTRFRRTCLTTWSAGSQLAKEVCLGPEEDWPEALVMLDGLYNEKPAGSRTGDGKAVLDADLEAVALYALSAARGQRICVLMHSNIPTPYASSKECVAAVRAYVEAREGVPFEPVEVPELAHAGLRGIARCGNLTIVEYGGADGAEHVREAHLFDEVWRALVPWSGDREAPTKVDVPAVYLPIARRIAERATDSSIMLAEKGLPGARPEYWAGTTRLRDGREWLLKIGNPAWPWCAAGFQHEAYDAAKALGLSLADVEPWTSGPIPHGRRVSVLELQNDYRARFLFRSAGDARAGIFEPAKGDAVFLDRGKNPAHGHVARYVRRVDAEHFDAVGGNEEGRWRVTRRRFDDPGLRGFGMYPREGSVTPCAPIEVCADDEAALRGES